MRDMILDDRERGVFRVNREAFTDPDVLDRERRQVFDRCWLYACHESELARPGDFIARKVGGRPLIFTRGDDGGVRAFFNACPHRGNLVCREKGGNARRFSCFYHAWTFGLDGQLIGVPGAESYSSSFRKEEMGLVPVPKVGNYRGMIFINYDGGAVTLEDYLGDAREYLDLALDVSIGESEIVRGSQDYSMHANWKLLVENSFDGYHFAVTHSRYLSYLNGVGVDVPSSAQRGATSRAVVLGNGHAVTENFNFSGPLAETAKAELAEIREQLIRVHGPERAARLADYSRNLLIFPNLILIPVWRTIRTFYPVSPDYMEVNAWALMPKGEPQHLRQARFENFISFLGPAGFGTPDDVAALEAAQQGFAAVPNGWSDLSRGMHKVAKPSMDELQMRSFWRRWNALVQGETGPTVCDDDIRHAEAAE